MKIAGLQKLTLLDFPGRTACTVFAPGCNLRCPFCHNGELVTGHGGEEISEESFFSFLEKRKGLLDGVAVTGGEPLLRPDVTDFLRRIKGMGYAVKLDTNGFFPEKLKTVLEEGLADYVAMDVKNSLDKYAATAGIPGLGLSPVTESIRMIMNSGKEYEFRTTAVREFHAPEDFEEIGRLIAGAEKYFIQGFIDSGGLICPGLSPLSREEMEECLERVRKYVPAAQLRGV